MGHPTTPSRTDWAPMAWASGHGSERRRELLRAAGEGCSHIGAEGGGGMRGEMCAGVELGPEGGPALAEFLRNNTTLRSLGLWRTTFHFLSLRSFVFFTAGTARGRLCRGGVRTRVPGMGDRNRYLCHTHMHTRMAHTLSD